MSVEEQGIDHSINRYKVIPRTLIFISHQDKILLIKGAPTKKIWSNLYNGVGGHIESNETVFEAALREIKEETGLTDIDNLKLRGTVNIETENPKLGITLFVFTATCNKMHTFSSQEGSVHWVNPAKLNHNQLVPDLPILLDRLYGNKSDAGNVFHAKYWYDTNNSLQIEFS